MKASNSFASSFWFRVLTAGLPLATVLWASPLMAAPTSPSQPAKTNTVRSVFTLPANPGEGRDPFFPKSNRPYESAPSVTNSNVVEVTSLVVRGVSGSTDHRLVIINNHTFAGGDEGDVTTPTGRIHLRCIQVKTNSVIVEVGGQIRELFYSNNP